jgi:hypothetical protein
VLDTVFIFNYKNVGIGQTVEVGIGGSTCVVL